KAFGFPLGGLLFNIFSHVVALIGLAVAFRRFFDARAAILVSWLFASYPGYAYWVGLPYSYAFIVPGSVACLIALLWLHERPSHLAVFATACVVGIVALVHSIVSVVCGAMMLMDLVDVVLLGVTFVVGGLVALLLFFA